MLADVINSGTAYRARQAGFTLPAAGKTGTTNDYVDAWFVGFTPHLVTGVWIGFDQPTTIIANGYAGELAVPMWASFMKVATKGDKPDWIARPANVVGINVCRVSGKLPNAGCTSVEVINREGVTETRSMVYTEYFVTGTQPTSLCPLHASPSFMDRLAGLFGGGPPEIPIGADQAGLPPERTGTSGRRRTSAPPYRRRIPRARTRRPKVEDAPKKRGFWGRLFGRGDKKRRDKKPDAREEARRRSLALPRERSAAAHPVPASQTPVVGLHRTSAASRQPSSAPDTTGHDRIPSDRHAIPQHHRASATARADRPGSHSRDLAAEPHLRGA